MNDPNPLGGGRGLIPASSNHRVTVAFTGSVGVNVSVAFAGLSPADDSALLAAITSVQDSLMSALSDKIAEVQQALNDATGRVQSDVAALEQKISDLEAQIAAGNFSQADLDALDALKTQLAAIDPTQGTTLNDVPDSGAPADQGTPPDQNPGG